jgi:indolepyruvate decarboxylase
MRDHVNGRLKNAGEHLSTPSGSIFKSKFLSQADVISYYKYMPRNNLTIGAYLIKRLQDYGVRHVFGIPGDYVLRFYEMIEESPIKMIGVTREDCAGYAADAYARVNGIGAVCVTYCVGGLNVSNSIAGAYAEKSPVVVLTGSPGLSERTNDPMLHHKIRTFLTQKTIFEEFTAAAVILDDPDLAYRQIDETLAACWREKRPVYIELPRDMVEVIPTNPTPSNLVKDASDKYSLREALAEAVDRLNKAKSPVILADIEIHRYNLGTELVKFVEKTNIPVAATLLGKSVISEKHPRYMGIYEGALGRPEVKKMVEDSDCLLMLGTFLTDLNLGIYTANLDRNRTVEATSEKVQIQHHTYGSILLEDFMKGLLKASIKRCNTKIPPFPAPIQSSRTPGSPMTVKYLFSRLNEFLDENMVVISDVGVCLFGSADLVIHRGTEFLAPAYYTSMGFAVPAALGAQTAKPKLRPIVLVGDGAFQMTGTELSTIHRYGQNPIVIILNNKGYTTERFIMDGPFNDIADWRFENMPNLIGGGWGCSVHTEKEFNLAFLRAIENKKTYSILNVHLDPMDTSPALERLGARLSAKLKKKKTSSKKK